MRKVWLFLDDAAGFGPGCQVWCKAEESSVKIALTNLIFSWSCTILLLERTPIGSDKSFPFLDPLDFEVMRELSKMIVSDCFDQGFFCELMKHCTKICLVIFLLHFFVHLIFFACSTNFFEMMAWCKQQIALPKASLSGLHTSHCVKIHTSQSHCVTIQTAHFTVCYNSHCTLHSMLQFTLHTS